MDLAADLHIHSTLSPCADKDMTPNNIVNMALLKGLDVISVTDHNSAKNLPAICQIAREKDIIVIPGLEVSTKEEIHVLCYFKCLKEALNFGEILYKYIPDIKNNKKYFGEQLIMDVEDKVVGEIEKLLISATSLSINELNNIVHEYKGIMVPAHIDKKAYSIISNLGFIPNDLNINTIEISTKKDIIIVKKKFNFSEKFNIIQSSDAHFLGDISEKDFHIKTKSMNIQNIFNFLSGV